MGLVDILGLVPLLGCFVLLCGWSYKFAFNHDLIRNYSNPHSIKKANVNSIIDREINGRYGCSLPHVDVDDELAGDSTAEPTFKRKTMAETHQENINLVVAGLFSVTTALSIELVGVLMLQLTGLFEADLAFFRLAIRVLVFLVTVVQPLLVVSLYVNQDLVPTFKAGSTASATRVASTLGLYVLWYVILHKMGEVADSLGGSGDKTFIERKTNEIVLTGITITAILSGVGSISTPFGSFWGDESLLKRKSAGGHTQETQLSNLIQQYNTTKSLMRKREAELNSLLASASGKVYNEPESRIRSLRGSGKQLFHKVSSFASLSKFGSKPEDQELQAEISTLAKLKESIYNDVSKSLHKFLVSKNAQHGSWWSMSNTVKVFNIAFSFYCVYRVLNVLLVRLPYHYFWNSENIHDSMRNVIDDKDSSESLNKNTKDALAITVVKILQSVGYLPMSETQLINQVSFILSGSLFVCSLQNVLVTFKSVVGLLPAPTTSVSSSVKMWLKNLLVSELLAIYVIATALLIRSNLPAETANSLSRILSLSTATSASTTGMQREVEFIDTWFDKVFGFTCIGTAIVVASKLFIESGNVYDDGYDEEMFIEDGAMFKTS
ncbi:Abscisic acid G-protein coupled receptor family protein [Clavispora lusitaniae]|uniref:Abscisic acid G-protein coupled receptor family protein n=1 Tax=Clavispora lusitaniae TaxID=36911 RepID=UPI00202BFAB0|nr:Abscisic acid G-protein coupled receptor family protein [Clavispora lusitaniae]